MKNFISWYSAVYSDTRNTLFGILGLLWLLSSAALSSVSSGLGAGYAIVAGVAIVGFNVYIARQIEKNKDDDGDLPKTPSA